MYGVRRTRQDSSSFRWHQLCQHCKYTTSVAIQKRAIKTSYSCRITCEHSESAREQRTALCKSDMKVKNNMCNSSLAKCVQHLSKQRTAEEEEVKLICLVRLTGRFFCLRGGLCGGGGGLMAVLGGHTQKGEHRELVSFQARHAHNVRPEADKGKCWC